MPLPVQIVIMVFFYSGKFEQSVLQFNLQKIDAQQVMMSLNYIELFYEIFFLFYFQKSREQREPP